MTGTKISIMTLQREWLQERAEEIFSQEQENAGGMWRPVLLMKAQGAYNGMNLSFSIMVHGITYPDEAVREEEKGKMTVRLWNAQMVDDVIHFPRPEECEIRCVLRDAGQKQFVPDIVKMLFLPEILCSRSDQRKCQRLNEGNHIFYTKVSLPSGSIHIL